MKIENFFYSFVEEKMDNLNLPYSWGEFYETMRTCDGYNEEENKKFAIFETLDKAITFEEIRNIVLPLTEYEMNWLNSPCLDGIVFSILNPKKFIEKEYLDSWKYFLQRNLVTYHSMEKICNYKHINVVWLLIHKFWNEISIENRQTILTQAAKNGWNEMIKFLFQNGVTITSGSVLYNAVFNNHIETVQLLLENGANIQALLQKASAMGFVEIVKILIQYKVDIHEQNDEALRKACKNGHIEVVKILLENGAIIDTEERGLNVIEDHALQLAAYYNHYEIVKLLLEKGADIHYQNDRALRNALDKNHFNIAKLLLENGANPYIIHNWDTRDKPITIEFLLRYGTDISRTKHILNGENGCLKFL